MDDARYQALIDQLIAISRQTIPLSRNDLRSTGEADHLPTDRAAGCSSVAPHAMSPENAANAPTWLSRHGETPAQPKFSPASPEAGRLTIRKPDPEGHKSCGNIQSLGKFLLDPASEQSIARMIDAGHGNGQRRVLTVEQANDLAECLDRLGSDPFVAGSIVIGYDGLLLAKALGQGMDAETMTSFTLATYISSVDIARKMGHTKVRQLVSQTEHGYVIFADFGHGILVTVTNKGNTDSLLPLLDKVEQISGR